MLLGSVNTKTLTPSYWSLMRLPKVKCRSPRERSLDPEQTHWSFWARALSYYCVMTRRKNFSQWERSFHWKLRCHWLEFLQQRQIAVVRQDPGLGKVKVAVDDAPMDFSNDLIREVLSVYGEVLDVRNDYLHMDGNMVPWWNGTRHVDMCNLKSEIPPTPKVRHGQNNIKIKLWHLVQLRIECKNKRIMIVQENLKGGALIVGVQATSNLSARREKQCFNCGESSHIAR